jgi:ribosomal protein S18 acetylase RimI-like enzyme
MFVHPAFRGQGIGESLVEALFEQTQIQGHKRVILDSHRSMTQAHKIYRKLGFTEVDAPPDFPEELKPVVIFMDCSL